MSFGTSGVVPTVERCASGRAGSRSIVEEARKPSGFVGTFTLKKSFFFPAMEPRVASAGANARSPAAKIAQSLSSAPAPAAAEPTAMEIEPVAEPVGEQL